MADTLKKLGKGTLGTTNETLYTVPTGTKTIVKSVILANKTASETTGTITFDGATVIPAYKIPANDTLVIQMTAIMEASTLIQGVAGANSAVDYYISGIEVV